MDRIFAYSAGLTAEQFLFQEMRISAKLFLEGKRIEEAIEIIRAYNLFQYPTEREISRLTRACYKRLTMLDNEQLVNELANAPIEIAKQIGLYAIMRYNSIVWDFMTQVIGEKFSNQDFSFSRKDLNMFFSRLQVQDDSVASWSDGTVRKIKSVLVRFLVETSYLDSIKDTTLQPIFLFDELESGIRANNDLDALPAFNCFR